MSCLISSFRFIFYKSCWHAFAAAFQVTSVISFGKKRRRHKKIEVLSWIWVPFNPLLVNDTFQINHQNENSVYLDVLKNHGNCFSEFLDVLLNCKHYILCKDQKSLRLLRTYPPPRHTHSLPEGAGGGGFTKVVNSKSRISNFSFQLCLE